jgi:hypothetical protein
VPFLRSSRYANVTATLALLFSLAGTGTAASLTVARLLPGSVTSKEIRDGSLTLRDLSPASIQALARNGSNGVVASSLKLAAYAKATPQTLPDDSTFHTVWSLHFKAEKKQVFLLTGNIGGGGGEVRTPGCPSGDSTFSELAQLDGSLLWEHDSNGSTTGIEPNGLVTFAPGNHTLSFSFRGDCPGFPANVPGEEVLMLPFTLP